MIEAEGIEVEFATDVMRAIGAEDVEGEASEAGEDCGFGSNTAVILEEGHVSNMMVAVFDTPVGADCGAGSGGGDCCLTGIE